AGILVTRAATKDQLGLELSKQLLLFPRALTLLAAMLAVYALVRGLPTLPFLGLATVVGFLARALRDEKGVLSALGEPARAEGFSTGGKPADTAASTRHGVAG